MSETETNTVEQAHVSNRITLATLGWFLLGGREAILTVANSRSALWLGAIFVLSAGFAREYDGEYLLREPWHLLIPFGASLLSSFVLYLMVARVRKTWGIKDAPFWQGYRQLLTLFWLTAPLAWLYAIPVERFTSAPDAIRYNLYLLGVVSAWRVALTIRFVAVLYNARPWAAIFLVMLFADVVAFLAIVSVPRPIVGMMGGIQHTEAERVILLLTGAIKFYAVITFPVWAIGTFVTTMTKKAWRSAITGENSISPIRVATYLWAFAAMSILIWIPFLSTPQAEQRNRWQVTHDLQNGRVEEAVRYMSARTPEDFPPHWDPPPRGGYGETNPPSSDVIEAVVMTDASSWVRDLFLEKFHFDRKATNGNIFKLRYLSDDRLRTYLDLLQSKSDGKKIAYSHIDELNYLLGDATGDEDDPPPVHSAERRKLLESIRAMAEDDETRRVE